MNSQDSDIPDDLRSAWQETRVRTPDALDRAVLKDAAAAAAGRSKRLTAWLQPLAYAATLVLGVALVYEMQTPARDAAPSATEATAPEEAFAGVSEVEQPADSTPAAREPAIRSLLNDRRIHELKATPSAAADSNQAAPATGRTEKSSVAGRQLDPGECRQAETTSAGDWWNCISSLREAGLDASAAAELERLRARYPDFTPPQ